MGAEELSQLNEAINHCDEVILKLKNNDNCEECLKQHEQLKHWLEMYKKLNVAFERACRKLEDTTRVLSEINAHRFKCVTANEWKQGLLETEEFHE